ncbi:hypothetical protein UABAM_05579 [Candidatus Uabimicrobium amorphum]|uniref:DUF11 domain-containing protein n=1 Tax=Uabimicrobium amorphum TaxID=2596890 RepID=A0A5S9IT70_UABAM|nr:hypothetical protein UABAM_05579 [Candidatus Uabimicrobium amorphum]
MELGQQTIYVVTVRNEGTSAITNVTLRNSIPQQMEFIKAEGPSNFTFYANSGKLESHSVAILQPGEKLTYKIVCKAIKEGSAKNTARVKYDQFNKEIIDEEGTSLYQ